MKFSIEEFRRDLINKRKTNLKAAAEEIGISASALSRLENYKNPSQTEFVKCCKWMGVKMKSYFK